MCFEWCKQNKESWYAIFRIFVGLMFLQHGLQKVFGLLGGVGGASVELFTLMGAAGIIELITGITITLGLFTRPSATLAAITMAVAFIYVHAWQGTSWIPALNGGELALLYFAAFLVLGSYGAGKWSLETKLWKKEKF
ncbi:DoxX family protein [Candidatus Woesearchaeota archaeon]|nr:DoxX family protein [Candidatus Woesearchaeota archaeon]|tara:strand:+ start:727 stop:1140 length:414 start_codon:yes stop_codon:yes gene_type:complete